MTATRSLFSTVEDTFVFQAGQKVLARRQYLFDFLRQEILFGFNRVIRAIFGYQKNISVGEKVRVQSLACLRAEQPSASIEVGSHSVIYENSRLEAFGAGKITVGESCILGDIRVSCREGVTFGDRVLTSWNIFIQDFDPHPVNPAARREQVLQMTGVLPKNSDSPDSFPSAPVVIGDDVWIGANAIILKGAQIGEGSIVAAGAIVPGKVFPPRSIIAGNPAKVVKEII